MINKFFFILIFVASLFEVIPSIIFKYFNPSLIFSLDLKNNLLLLTIFILWNFSILIWIYCIKTFHYSVSLFCLISFDLIIVGIVDYFIFDKIYSFINLLGILLTFFAIYLLKNDANA